MKRRDFITRLGGAGLFFTHVMFGNVGIARAEGAVDRLLLPGSIEFNGESYRLSWRSHSKPHYYKQEYLPANQTIERFQRMVLIEAIVRGPISTARWLPSRICSPNASRPIRPSISPS